MKRKEELRQERVEEYKRVECLSECLFCKARFDTQEDLDAHNEYQHGSYSKNKHIEHTEKHPDSSVGRIYKKYYLDRKKASGRDLSKAEALEMINMGIHNLGENKEYYDTHPTVFDKTNIEYHSQVKEKDRLYSPSGRSFCRKTSKQSADRLFEKLAEMKEDMKTRGTTHITPPEEYWSIFGDSLSSNDNIYVGYYYLYNRYRETYEMYSSWGTRIKYIQEEIKDDDGKVVFCMSCFCPVDVWNKYKEKQKNVVNVEGDNAVDYFIGGK